MMGGAGAQTPSPSAAGSESPSPAASVSPTQSPSPTVEIPVPSTPVTPTDIPTVKASPALAPNSSLRLVARVSYTTNGARGKAEGEAVWRFVIPRLYPVWSQRGTTTYVARQGTWEGVGHASGVDIREGGRDRWYYAFNKKFPCDRPSSAFPGGLENVSVVLFADGPTRARYRLVVHGNGVRPGATNDTFAIERHSYDENGKTQTTQMPVGWAPFVIIGARPEEMPATSYAPQNALAGALTFRRPQWVTPSGTLQGQAQWSARSGDTNYQISVVWTSKPL